MLQSDEWERDRDLVTYRGCVYVPRDPQLHHDIIHAHHYHRVMVGMDDIMVELGISWDIHTSPVCDQVSVSFPFIRLEHACSKLSEHFDYCVIIVHASPDTFHQLIASTVH